MATLDTQTSQLKALSGSIIAVAIGLVLAILLGGTIGLGTYRPYENGFMSALLSGTEVPLAQHVLIALFFVVPLGIAFARRRVLVLPPSAVTIAGFYLAILLLATTGQSAFRAISWITVSEWFLVAASFLAVVVVAGRTAGPKLLLGAIAAGTVLVALIGLREFANMKALDPNWRIFAGWMNPNALAGILVLGIFPCVGGLVTARRPVHALLCGLGAALIGFALLLTGSKGGLLSLAVGIGVFLLYLLVRHRHGILPVLAVVGIVATLSFAQSRSSTSGAAAGLSRMQQGEATQVQSVGFRKQLWLTAVDLMRKNPLGSGPGTFRFESGRPQRVTPTVLAHNSWLQLGAEASPLAPILVFAMLYFIQRAARRGLAKHEAGHETLVWCLFAAILAGVTHNCVDSLLYHFGYAVIFASMLGLCLALSPDGSAPEIVPPSIRGLGLILTGVVPLILLGLFARGEQVRAAITPQSSDWSALSSLTMPEGETFVMLAKRASSPTEQFKWLEQAVGACPSVRNNRLLAETSMKVGKLDVALRSLEAARKLDPANPVILTQLYDFYEAQGDETRRDQIFAEAMATENSTYYTVRSLPEIVPTETALLRLKQAKHLEPEAARQVRKQAAAILLGYYKVTFPRVKAIPMPLAATEGFGGETLARCQERLQVLATLASESPVPNLDLSQLREDLAWLGRTLN